MLPLATLRASPTLHPVTQPPSPPTKKRRLGEILRDAGVLSELQLNAALSEQKKWGGRLGRTLVEMGFVDEDSMMLALSRQLNLPLVDLDRVKLPPDVAKLMRVDIAERYGVFPVQQDPKHKVLQIATSDPTNQEQLNELGFHTGMRIQVALSSPSAIDRAVRRYYYGDDSHSSPTSTPQELGVDENQFDPEQLGGNRPSAPAASNAASAAEVRELSERLSQALQQIATLEQLLASQVRVARGLIELLVNKGIISREEYLAKVRGGGQQ